MRYVILIEQVTGKSVCNAVSNGSISGKSNDALLFQFKLVFNVHIHSINEGEHCRFGGKRSCNLRNRTNDFESPSTFATVNLGFNSYLLSNSIRRVLYERSISTGIIVGRVVGCLYVRVVYLLNESTILMFVTKNLSISTFISTDEVNSANDSINETLEETFISIICRNRFSHRHNVGGIKIVKHAGFSESVSDRIIYNTRNLCNHWKCRHILSPFFYWLSVIHSSSPLWFTDNTLPASLIVCAGI